MQISVKGEAHEPRQCLLRLQRQLPLSVNLSLKSRQSQTLSSWQAPRGYAFRIHTSESCLQTAQHCWKVCPMIRGMRKVMSRIAASTTADNGHWCNGIVYSSASHASNKLCSLQEGSYEGSTLHCALNSMSLFMTVALS